MARRIYELEAFKTAKAEIDVLVKAISKLALQVRQEKTAKHVDMFNNAVDSLKKVIADVDSAKEEFEDAKNAAETILKSYAKLKDEGKELPKEKTQSNELQAIVNELDVFEHIDSNTPVKYHKQPAKEQIIETIAGGDKTHGSCMSLSFAYMGNLKGYKVRDFRGGKSQDYFSKNYNIGSVLQLAGIKIKNSPKNETDLAYELLETAEAGKEYCLIVGKHASMVRKVEEENENGEASSHFEYLELQSRSKCGWKTMGDTEEKVKNKISWRFDARRFGSHSGAYFFDAADLTQCEEFDTILGYINTPRNKQHKGATGSIK